MFKKEIIDLVSKKTKLKKQEIEELIEIPRNPEMGDYAFPCFTLSKKYKKNPAEIAKEIVLELKPKGNIEKIQEQGPYINFFIDKKALAKALLEDINNYYGETKEGKNKKIVIDFSAPNIGKPMHVGHIRSTILGDSLLRIYHFLGYKPIGINYLGDIGLHIGKLIVAYELWLNKKALKDNPVKELLRLYVKFNKEEESEFVEGQEPDYEGNEWTQKAREKLRLLELGDKEAEKIWDDIREASGKGFDKVYKILNIEFHETTGQSKFSEAGKEIVLNATKKGIAKTEKDGAIYVEFDNLPKKYILKSDGTASYITQDIAAAVERYKKHNFEKMLYVTDFRQELHFQQLFEILKKFGYNFSNKCEHIGFGTVNFGKEIIASRKGKVILLEEVLEKTIEKAKQSIKSRKTKGNPEKVGVAAIKYAILRNEPIKDVQFSWKEALNFEGETGPYIQYSYARASSILRKSKKKPKLTMPTKLEDKEILLIKKIQDFPKEVKRAARDFNPSIIANYAYKLAQIFNEFYHDTKVIGTKEEEFRLKLIEAFRITIKNALYLLGIDVMEEM